MSKFEKTFAGGNPLTADELNQMAAAINDNDDQIASLREGTNTKLSELDRKIGDVFIESVNINPASSLLTEIYLKKDISYTIEAKKGEGSVNIEAYIDNLYSEARVKIDHFNESVEFTPVHSGLLRLYNGWGATSVSADIKVSITNSLSEGLSNIEGGLSDVKEELSNAQKDIVKNSQNITENTGSIEQIKYVDGSRVEAEINAVVDTSIVVKANKQYKLTFISDDTLNIEVYVKNNYGNGYVNITKSGEAVNYTPADSGSLVVYNNGVCNIIGNLLCGVEESIAFDSKKNEYEIQSIEKRLIGYRSFIKLNESAEVEKRAVPYSIGTPTKSIAWSGAYDRFNFIFFSDSHIDSPASASEYSIENIIDVVNFANTTKMNISILLNGGDYITPFGAHSKESQKEVAKPFFDALKKSRIPVMVAKGNHDTNDWYNFPSDAFLPQDYDEMFNGYMKSKFGTMHNTGGSYAGKNYVSPYFYKDFDEYKIRVIVLDNMDYPVGDNYVTQEVVNGYSSGRCLYNGQYTFCFRQEQMDWLINDALNFNSKTEKDWGVIVCTHNIYRFYEHRFYQTKDVTGTSVVQDADGSCRKLLKVLNAFDAHATYSSNYQCSEPQFSLNINADFTSYASEEKKPYVVGVFHGHEHIDANEVIEGINIIYIGNGSASNQSSDQKVARIPETSTQNLFDVVSVDQVAHKLYITRYGAGVDCYGNGGDRFKPNGLGFAYPKSMISVAPNAVVSSGIMLQAGKTYQVSFITDDEFSSEIYIESQYSLGMVDISTDSSVVEFKPADSGNLVAWNKGESTFNTIVMCKEL